MCGKEYCPAKKKHKSEDRLRYKSHNRRLVAQPGDFGLDSKWQAGPAYLSKERTDRPLERKFSDNKTTVKHKQLMDGDVLAADLVELEDESLEVAVAIKTRPSLAETRRDLKRTCKFKDCGVPESHNVADNDRECNSTLS